MFFASAVSTFLDLTDDNYEQKTHTKHLADVTFIITLPSIEVYQHIMEYTVFVVS